MATAYGTIEDGYKYISRDPKADTVAENWVPVEEEQSQGPQVQEAMNPGNYQAPIPQVAQSADAPNVPGMEPEWQEYLKMGPEDRKAMMVFKQKQQKEETFRKMGELDKLVAGVGTYAYAFPGMEKLAELAGYGKADEKKENQDLYKQASIGLGIEDLGEVLPDIALAATGAGVATKAFRLGRIATMGIRNLVKGTVAGTTSATAHQLQNVGSGRDVSGGEVAAEVGLSAALPAIGGKIGQSMKKLAPKLLQRHINPPAAMKQSINPPDANKALILGLQPRVSPLSESGAKAGLMKTSAEMKRLGGLRDDALAAGSSDAQGLISRGLNFKSGVMKNAEAELATILKSTKNKNLSRETAAGAQEAFDHWKKEATGRATYKNGWMTPEDAEAFREVIDKELKFRRGNGTITNGFNRGSMLVRQHIEDYTRNAFPEVRDLTRKMSRVVPWHNAVKNRVENPAKDYSWLVKLAAVGGPGTLGALSGTGSSGSTADGRDHGSQSQGKIGAVAGALTGLTIAQLMMTPGGAAILYRAGRGFMKPSMGRDLAVQTARTLGYQSFKDDYAPAINEIQQDVLNPER